MDLFASSVQWNVQGKQVTTKFGMLLTLMIVILMLVYGARKFAMMISMENPQVTRYNMQVNLADRYKIYKMDPDSTGFKFSFSLDFELPPSIGYFEVTHTRVTTIKNESSEPIRKKEQTVLDYERCDLGSWGIHPNLVHEYLTETIGKQFCVKPD